MIIGNWIAIIDPNVYNIHCKNLMADDADFL